MMTLSGSMGSTLPSICPVSVAPGAQVCKGSKLPANVYEKAIVSAYAPTVPNMESGSENPTSVARISDLNIVHSSRVWSLEIQRF
jgi:hypothetical protein